MLIRAKQALVVVLALLIAFFAYQLGFAKGESRAEVTVDTEMIEEIISQSDTQDFPSCNSGRCPEYKSMDTDGDLLPESVVYIPIAMTKGAATVWIIDDNKVVFKSGGGAMLSYKQNDDIPGITVSYVSEFERNGIDPKTWVSDKWIHIDGDYVLAEDYEGFCEEHLDLNSNDETITPFEGNPKNPDFTYEPEAEMFRTAINKAVSAGANYAGHYTIATWGCGTDCFGYAVVDLITGEIVTISSVNESYNINGLEVKGRYLIVSPVYKGQDKKYYKLSEYINFSDETNSVFTMACTEKSSKDVYRQPE